MSTSASKRLSQTSTSTNTSKRKSQNHVGPWKLGRTLGRGSTGRVRLAKHSVTGQLAAVKIVPKSNFSNNKENGKDNKEVTSSLPYGIEREIIIMKLITHPNIMALYDVWENKNELYLVLEYIEGGELFDHLIKNGRLSEEESVAYFKQIIHGIHYCHQFNICHRDLKPENLLLDKHKNIKIADFGMAALEMSEKLLETSCGSPHYASPEIVAGKTYHGAPSDIWSCGIILFALLTGHLPFDDENIRKLLMKVQSGKYSMPPNLSANAKNLISRMLKVLPEDRITIDEILLHPLLLSYPDPVSFDLKNPNLRQNLKPIEHESFDMEILKNLQILFHGAKQSKIIENLTNPVSNSEKIFYHLLLKYRHDHSTIEDDPNVSTIEIEKKKKSIKLPRSKSVVKIETHDDEGKLIEFKQSIISTPKSQVTKKSSERVLTNITNNHSLQSHGNHQQANVANRSNSRKKIKKDGRLIISASTSFKKPVSFNYGKFNTSHNSNHSSTINNSIISNEKILNSSALSNSYNYNDGTSEIKNDSDDNQKENIENDLQKENMRVIRLRQELVRKQEIEQKRQSLLLLEKSKEAMRKLREQEMLEQQQMEEEEDPFAIVLAAIEKPTSVKQETADYPKLDIRKKRGNNRYVSEPVRKPSLDPKNMNKRIIISEHNNASNNSLAKPLLNKQSFNRFKNLSSSSSRNLSSYLSVSNSVSINDYNQVSSKYKNSPLLSSEPVHVLDKENETEAANESGLIPNPRFSRFSFNGLLNSKFDEQEEAEEIPSPTPGPRNHRAQVSNVTNTMISDFSIGDVISTHTANIIKFEKPVNIPQTTSTLASSDIYQDAIENFPPQLHHQSSNLNLKKLKKVNPSTTTTNKTNIRMSLYAGNQVYDINREDVPSDSPIRDTTAQNQNEILKSAKQNSQSVLSIYQDIVEEKLSILSKERTNIFDDDDDDTSFPHVKIDVVNDSVDTFKHPVAINESFFSNDSPFSNDEFLETSSLRHGFEGEFKPLEDSEIEEIKASDSINVEGLKSVNIIKKVETETKYNVQEQVIKKDGKAEKAEKLDVFVEPKKVDSRSNRSSIFSNHKPDFADIKKESKFKNSSILRRFSLKPQREAPKAPGVTSQPPVKSMLQPLDEQAHSRQQTPTYHLKEQSDKRASNAATIETGFSYVPIRPSAKEEIEEVDEFLDIPGLTKPLPKETQKSGKQKATSSSSKPVNLKNTAKTEHHDDGMKQSWFAKMLNNFVSGTGPSNSKDSNQKLKKLEEFRIASKLSSSNLFQILTSALELKQMEGTLTKISVDSTKNRITANVPARLAHGRILKFSLNVETSKQTSSAILVKEKGSSKSFKNLHQVVQFIIKNEEKLIEGRRKNKN